MTGEEYPTDEQGFGKRDRKTDRRRLYAGIVLLLIVVAAEVLIGGRLQNEFLAGLSDNGKNDWATQRYLDPSGSIPVVPKPAGVKRLLYISNSHGLTGGKVSRHLQALLNRLFPGRFEVLDLSTGGVFAPEILERLASGLDAKPDAVILAPAYISFSDRMKLSRQRLSARSFFNGSVFSKLPAAFFLRNWDITLFTDTLAARCIKLFRHRNALRDLWEKPLAGSIRKVFPEKGVLFLEVDEDQNWRFPEGFDHNLFNWLLYSLGRKSHLKDMEAAVRLVKNNHLPLLGLNMPVDWDKDPHERNDKDVARYQETLRKAFSGADLYMDYENTFPKEFSTYDALHPNWFGARLHALDIALRLRQMGVIDSGVSPEEIARAFTESDEALSDGYRKEVDGSYPPITTPPGMRRYDIFEPENARDILRRLASAGPANSKVREMIIQLCLRIRFWEEMPFNYSSQGFTGYDVVFYPALSSEIAKARQRADFFKNALEDFQGKRLAACPVPQIGNNKPEEIRMGSVLDKPVEIRSYTSVEKIRILQYLVPGSERTIAFGLMPPRGSSGCLRNDIFGDGSFALGCLVSDPFVMPPWASGLALKQKWGF
ncbi:MAG: hypothetical protein AB1921_03230 [Thermodesulfobacteriota bacterium]